MGNYEKQIEELKKKIDNPILKTHVGARVCDMGTCKKHGIVQITSHYVCPYCGMGMKTIEGAGSHK
jgi:hypothetical protein